ncbi:MAG: SnoaL-like domain-containing protein [Hasllibacter sp.]
MELKQIAEELVAGCRAGNEKVRENLDRLYADDAVSVEAMEMGMDRATKGREGIRGKHDWWEATFEEHGTTADGPFLMPALGGDPDRFAVLFGVDATHKESGERTKMQEVGLYTVEGGKIVREEFFPASAGMPG